MYVFVCVTNISHYEIGILRHTIEGGNGISLSAKINVGGLLLS